MKKLFLSVALFLSVNFYGQVNTFTFTVSGATPPGFSQALTTAGQNWSNYLQINVPIKVNVIVISSPLIPFSGLTLANGRKNFANAPFPNILYPTALANQLAGTETNPGEYDMDIYFNLNSTFYFGTGKPPVSQMDFITTAMHEIGHGLGFYSDGYVDASGNGSFGNVPPSAIAPASTSFPWRGQDSVPSIYDKYIVRASGTSLINAAAPYSTAMGDSIETGPLYFSGPVFANPSHSNTPIRISGGNGPFSLGEDLLHVHNTYPNTIMSYYWGGGDTVRTPGPWEMGILKEIGWNPKIVGVKEQNNYSVAVSYPNPANMHVAISAQNMKRIKVYSMQGELVQTQPVLFNETEISIDTKDWKEGMYFFQIEFSNTAKMVSKKIVVKH